MVAEADAVLAVSCKYCCWCHQSNLQQQAAQGCILVRVEASQRSQAVHMLCCSQKRVMRELFAPDCNHCNSTAAKLN
jgi:hypothetical protein